MGKLKDLTGQIFGRLTVVKRAPTHKKRTKWECSCSCGNICVTDRSSLLGGLTRSCGCLIKETTSRRNISKVRKTVCKICNIHPREKKSSYCRSCRIEYSKQHFIDHPQWYKDYHVKRLQSIREYVRGAKSIPCTDCGQSFHYCVMDFDHRDPTQKVAVVSHMVSNSESLTRIKLEIAKCDVVCSNCHRLRTFARSLRGQLEGM